MRRGVLLLLQPLQQPAGFHERLGSLEQVPHA
jgi:hypothetical protein